MHRRQLLKLGAATAATALATLAAPALRAQPLTKLRFTLDYRVTGQTAPFLVALAKGYYKEEGLDVTIDAGSGSVASITRVVTGAYDIGLGDINSLIEYHAAATGTPALRAVYQYYNRASFAIIGRKDRGITDFKSLEGKRIAAAAVESTKRAWPMVARKTGLADDAFNWITTDFSLRDNVIVRGDVDGATYFHDSAVTLFQRMKPDTLTVLSFADAGVNLYGNAVLASTRLINDNPNALAAFLRASNRGLQDALANPVAAMAIVKQRDPLIDEKVQLESWLIAARYLAAPDTRTHGLGDVRKELVTEQITMVADTFGLKTRPTVDSLYDLRFLPPLADRTVKV